MPAKTENSKTKNLSPAIPHWNGHPVRHSEDERFHATDMWKANGAAERNKPKQWLCTQDANELCEEIEETPQRRDSAFEADTGFQAVVTIRGGKNAGTWMCVEMALAYAAYLDKRFYLWMLRSFLAAGRLPGEVAAIHARLQRMEAKLDRLAGLVEKQARQRRVEADDATRLKHWRVVASKSMGVCPCCSQEVIAFKGDKAGEWAKEVFVWRHYAGTRAGLQFSWPVCAGCDRRLKNDDFKRMKAPKFDAYQADVAEWLAENEPEMLPRP